MPKKWSMLKTLLFRTCSMWDDLTWSILLSWQDAIKQPLPFHVFCGKIDRAAVVSRGTSGTLLGRSILHSFTPWFHYPFSNIFIGFFVPLWAQSDCDNWQTDESEQNTSRTAGQNRSRVTTECMMHQSVWDTYSFLIHFIQCLSGRRLVSVWNACSAPKIPW